MPQPQVGISSLSTGALQALIREVETAIAFRQNPGARSRLQDVLRAARSAIWSTKGAGPATVRIGRRTFFAHKDLEDLVDRHREPLAC
jgi:hypothetical protein